jgi:CubicO group peptidase (beta-lactamase class C family)
MSRWIDRVIALAAASALGGVAPAHAGLDLPAPFAWKVVKPEDRGMSAPRLAALRADLVRRQTSAFVVARGDAIVEEWYAPGKTARDLQGTASLAKAVVGGMALAVAIDDGRIRLDDAVVQFVPQWRADPKKARVTIRQLGAHASGLGDAEEAGLPHDKLEGWKGDFWKRLDPPHDPFTIARDRAPVLFEPGERLSYSNPGIAMLSYAVAAAYGDDPRDLRELLRERVYRPIGVGDHEWSAGYGKTFRVEGRSLIAAWGGGAFAPRALASLGRLIVRRGDWDGRRVLSETAIRQVVEDAGLPGHCGMGWWTNADGRYKDLPRDAVWGAGAGDQVLFVVPSLELVMVRNGRELAPPPKTGDVLERYHDPRARVLLAPLVQAVLDAPKPSRSAAPYPPSPVVTGVEWAPCETIARFAPGSDNWPITWADDDSLYAAYGDGRGFAPFTPEKLSLGLARIDGGPDAPRGRNVRAPSLERTGDGPTGLKASGLLMVEGTLYLWARNASNARLAWSRDRGPTWTWADWRFETSFGCPTFLNFGRDYAGARDAFVYVYSPDGDSAYEPADRMVLARVSKGRVADRAAYEFFAGLDPSGSPRWSRGLEDRAAVFAHPGRCYRSAVTYDAPLRRYLWVQILPESADPRGPRFQGGFGVYDAPEPWGPWTTVEFTNDWDVGPGDTASFPSKWMSADGRTLHLVFSGDDAFSVRRAVLKSAR